MVHALGEIHRVLKPGGILIDLRPIEERWPVEIATATSIVEAGRLTDLPTALADNEAASHAVLEAHSHGWFTRNLEEEFPLFYYWDTPSEMSEFLETEWDEFEKLEESEFAAVKSVWATANADARIRIRVKMLITKWGKR